MSAKSKSKFRGMSPETLAKYTLNTAPPYFCKDNCGFQTDSQGSLYQHYRTKHILGERPKYGAAAKKRVADQSQNGGTHREVSHTTDLPDFCPKCGYNLLLIIQAMSVAKSIKR